MESRRLTLRVEQLEAFLRFLSLAQTEIRFTALPVEQIVERHGGELMFLQKCANECSLGKPFTVSWEESVNSQSKTGGFLPSDLELLKSFGSELGASDVEGQLSHCSLYSELIRESLKNAREEKNRKSRLYQILGIFSGMAAALVLC